MARKTIKWEWAAEHVDEHEDIVDLDHCDELTRDFIDQPLTEGCVRVDFCLTRRTFKRDGELDFVDYWYPCGTFVGGGDVLQLSDVPKIYIEQARKFGLLKAEVTHEKA